MTIGPPKCKICGVAEWRHICSLSRAKARVAAISERKVVAAKRTKPKRKGKSL